MAGAPRTASVRMASATSSALREPEPGLLGRGSAAGPAGRPRPLRRRREPGAALHVPSRSIPSPAAQPPGRAQAEVDGAGRRPRRPRPSAGRASSTTATTAAADEQHEEEPAARPARRAGAGRPGSPARPGHQRSPRAWLAPQLPLEDRVHHRRVPLALHAPSSPGRRGSRVSFFVAGPVALHLGRGWRRCTASTAASTADSSETCARPRAAHHRLGVAAVPEELLDHLPHARAADDARRRRAGPPRPAPPA